MRNLLTALALAAVPLTPAAAQTAGFTGSYTQDFDQLGPTGTTLTALDSGEWSAWRFTGSNTTWQTSVNAASLSSGVQVNDTTSPNQLVIYNAGAAALRTTNAINAGGQFDINDRALGTSPTQEAGEALQLSLTNDTGATITSVSLSYDTIVLSAINAANELAGYRLFYSLTGATGSWMAAPTLDAVTNPTTIRSTSSTI